MNIPLNALISRSLGSFASARRSVVPLGVMGAICLAPFAAAQLAPQNPTPPPASDKSEPIVLSPFSVNSTGDTGYQAGNTLAGSRINTKLSETPAAISVFTQEFLKDIGATGLANVLEYGVNANEDFNAVSTAPSFFFYSGGLLNDVRVNNRGMFASKMIDFLETTMPIDTYNTGRFDVSSGPNSILFGLGAAGGVVSASTRAVDLRRNSVDLDVKIGSWNSYRTEADLNIVAVKDRVGLRLMGMHDESDSWRRYGKRDSDRWTAEVAFKPFKATTATALYERGNIITPTLRPFNRADNLSFWWQRGRPTIDNTSFGTSNTAVQNASGTRGIGIRNVWISNDGSPLFTRAGSANTVVYQSASRYEVGVDSGIATQLRDTPYQTLLPSTPQASGLPYQPYDINYAGPEAVRTNHINRKFFRIEQQFGREGFVELAYNNEYGDGLAYQAGHALYGDPNLFLPNPNGTATRVPNPHVGQLYTDDVWAYNVERTRNEVLRATASWRIDLGRWGEHRLAGMGERFENDYRTTQGPEILVNAATKVPIMNATAPENSQNQLSRRNYVTAGAPETYLPGSRFDSRPITYGGNSYVGRYVGTTSNNGARRETDSLMLATQSRFFKGRFIVTGGVRRDNFDITPYTVARLAATDPLVTSGAMLPNEWALLGDNVAAARSYKITTYTAGAVLEVTKWLRAFYNESNNNGLPPSNRTILPDANIPTLPEGVGRDYGAMFSFLDGRIFARATAFNTAATNDSVVRDTSFLDAHRRIINAFRDNGLITQAEADAHSFTAWTGHFMSDLQTRGYEFELKANPNKNWSVTAAYSYTKLERTNVGLEWFPWFAAQKDYYARFPSSLITTNNIPVSAEITGIENGVDNVFALNKIGFNSRPHKANAFVRYSFDSERLKGFFVGGGVRWQDKNILQREILGFDALGKDILGKILYGPEIFNVDALVGYSTRLKWNPLGRDATLRVQLNVQNALDSDSIQVVRWNRVGDGYWRVVPREPRNFRLSASFGF